MDNIKEKQTKEAIARLEILQEQGLHPQVLEDFKEGKVNFSERMSLGASNPAGILYWLDGEPEWAKKVREVEAEYGVVVYHATHERFAVGEVLDLFCVTQDEEEWTQDRDDLRDGYALVYACNLSIPEFSEWGVFECAGGGLVRVS